MTQAQLNDLNQRPLEKRILGRTGLAVTQLGLGAGGNSRLGLSLGQSEEHAAGVVEAALEMGLTLVDTARGYRTEEAVGKALRGTRRENVVVSSKSGYLDEQRQLHTAQALEAELEKSLEALGLETIDIYFLHGLRREYYEAATERFVPVLDKARQAGKIRFMGITEAFESDTRHEMLQRAVLDDCWDVMMVGYNLINQSARERVLAETRRKGIATLGMFAVRRGLIDEERLRVLLGRMAAGEHGEVQIELALAEAPDLMGALGLRGIAESLSEAAYRFCAYEPMLDCVLSGTSSAEHLRQNLAAVQRGPLPVEAVRRLERIFGRVDSVSAQIRQI
jgi:L-galactose dehydrogenase